MISPFLFYLLSLPAPPYLPAFKPWLFESKLQWKLASPGTLMIDTQLLESLMSIDPVYCEGAMERTHASPWHLV